MLDRCYFCKARIVEQLVTIDYRWWDTLVVIRNVPAGVCQQYGEKYLTSAVYKVLERLAKNKSHLMGKIAVDILAFEAASTCGTSFGLYPVKTICMHGSPLSKWDNRD